MCTTRLCTRNTCIQTTSRWVLCVVGASRRPMECSECSAFVYCTGRRMNSRGTTPRGSPVPQHPLRRYDNMTSLLRSLVFCCKLGVRGCTCVRSKGGRMVGHATNPAVCGDRLPPGTLAGRALQLLLGAPTTRVRDHRLIRVGLPIAVHSNCAVGIICVAFLKAASPAAEPHLNPHRAHSCRKSRRVGPVLVL